MKNVTFYRGAAVLATVKLDTGSSQVRQIMGDDEVRLKFRTTDHIDFQFNDYCTIFGTKYILLVKPQVKKVASRIYEYNLTARSENLEIEKAQYLFLGADNTLREGDFSLMGTAQDFLNLLVENMNRVATGWTVGTVDAGTQYKNLTFSKESCLAALDRIAEEFETEWWIKDKTISLGKLQVNTLKVFEYGKGKGLYEIIRQQEENQPIITRLYAYGSTKNLPPDYRNYAKRLMMTGGVTHIDYNTATYGVVESTAIFEDIYPSRTGTLSWVDPANVLKFRDNTLNFDINDNLLPGVRAKVSFITGQMAGLSFEISNYDDATKEFTILLNKDTAYLDLPNDNLKPAVGDQYVLVDMTLPNSYVVQAEADLALRAQAMIEKLNDPGLSYVVSFDQKYGKENNLVLNCGDLVRILDPEMNVDIWIRVLSFTRDIVQEYDLKVELGNTVRYGTIRTIQSQQATTQRQVVNVQNQLNNSRVLNNIFTGDQTLNGGTFIVPDIPIVQSDLQRYPVYWDQNNGRFVVYQP